MSFNWDLFFNRSEKIGLFRLASILAKDYSFRIYNDNEESPRYRKVILDIMLLVSDAINIKEIKGETIVNDQIVEAKEILEIYNMSDFMNFEYMVEKYNKATISECSFVYTKDVILWLYAMPDGAEYLPPSLIEYLNNEEKPCQELSQPQSPQFRNINLDEFPLIRDVIAMLEKGKSKDEIADYLCSRGVTRTNAGLLLHDNPYNVSDDALKKFTDRSRNKNN